MEINRCVCKKKVGIYLEAEGYKVACPRCTRESKAHDHPLKAIIDWNREKTMRDMIREVGEDAIVVG